MMLVEFVRADMYEKILVPTDGSENADRGIAHALDMAVEHDAEIHVLFVVDEGVYGGSPATSSYELALEKIADEAEDVAEEVAEEATERGIDSTTSIRRGKPADEILRYVEDHEVDVVVMGKRGAGDPGKFRLGSVTERVLSGTDVPVVPV